MDTRKWKKLLAITVGALLTTGTVLAANCLAAKKAEFTLRMQSHQMPSAPGYQSLDVEFTKNVYKMSGGRIKIKLFPVGALYPVEEGLEAVGNGIVDIGSLVGFFFTGKMGQIASLESGVPGAERNALERIAFFYEKGFIDLIREAYKPHNIYYLGPHMATSWDMQSKKPIRSRADFNGLKIRGSAVEGQWWKNYGAEAVFIGGAEVYTALATGVVDAMRWGHVDQNYQRGFHEVAKYYIQPAMMPAPNNNILVNLDLWNKLPEDLQAILESAARLATMTYLAKSTALDNAAMKKLLDYGTEISTIEPAEYAEMEKDARKIWRGYASDSPLAARAVKMMDEFLAELGR